MSVHDVIRERRSIRKYLDKEVELEKIEKIVEAGMFAPTGRGLQSPKILVVRNKEWIKRLSEANKRLRNASSDPFYGAPVVIVVLANKDIPTYIYDGSIVMQNMMLEAYELHLGSCWIHGAKQVFEDEVGKELLKTYHIEGNYEGIGNLIIGYSDQDKTFCKQRKSDYVTYID